MAELTLHDVTKVYDDADGSVTAVDEASLTVEDGEFLVLVGPSGCGKSTTLRMIAGLETVTEGEIEIRDREVQHLAPSERDIAMVFQSYALYKRMTARQNMGYGLKHSTDMSADERERQVDETAELLGIEQLLDDKPEAMSGGQKQRVALGRAIVRDPDVFLLDEPLSNLDAKLRSHMRTELQRIQDDLGVTAVYVTHDQTEAMTMADRLAIMDDGVVQQVDPPEYAYDHPANEFVGSFLGSPAMNVFDAVARADGDAYEIDAGGTTVGRFPKEAVDENIDGGTVRFGVRPEDLHLEAIEEDTTDTCAFSASVDAAEYQGNDNFVYLDVAGHELTARVPPGVYPDAGDDVTVRVAAEDVYLFDPETTASIKTRGVGDEQTSTQPITRG
ncbi:carbohydrate ABC transporter ATP-binding protein, CUT1 family [Natronoarchaeum philippinense]|uniref:ABC-type D-xylose/L-arabinose transporter n=1 Tax=Natronoarchaeum philippinense TaxID=558529 RepID=A0A285NTW1_NATPI|nr:ATP-binding cassette domain-containing protein [Natronoarchaeum philippinense]SNZ12447.1 carbohydrate ABC transporter ATP-binding protein, CUT1 family [Natronoarchaeum philippinense]